MCRVNLLSNYQRSIFTLETLYVFPRDECFPHTYPQECVFPHTYITNALVIYKSQ